jgi:hypothetical protein
MPKLINFGSFQVNFLRSKHDTKGALDIFELILSPEGKMPVPHYHESWEETVYGLEGTITYTIAGAVRHRAGRHGLCAPRSGAWLLESLGRRRKMPVRPDTRRIGSGIF